MITHTLAIGAVLALAACSSTPGTGMPTHMTAPPAVASDASQLPVDSPGAMPPGSFLTLTQTFPSRQELAGRIPFDVFDPAIEGAITAAYVYLISVSRAMPLDPAAPVDITILHELATDDCSWCRSHELILESPRVWWRV